MLSSVFLTGRLGEKLDDKVRYVEVDRVIPGPTGKFLTDKIPCRGLYGPRGRFMSAPAGSFIALKGRIEMDERHGLIIVAEIDEMHRPRKEEPSPSL